MRLERRPRRATSAALALILAGVLPAFAIAAEAPGRPVPDTYTATTAHMSPPDLGLKIDVIEWSDAAARSGAVRAVESGADALHALPTRGYVWLDGSGVGYAVKYAHREATGDGGERVTFVTDRPLGAYSFKPWTTDAGATEERPYSVIELILDADGRGQGTLSMGADVSLDADHGMIRLDAAGTRLLNAAMRQPKPYWAKPSG